MIEILTGGAALLAVFWLILGVVEFFHQLNRWYPFEDMSKFQWFLLSGAAIMGLLVFGFLSFWIGDIILNGFVGDVK